MSRIRTIGIAAGVVLLTACWWYPHAATPVASRAELQTWGMPGAPRFKAILFADGSIEVTRESLPIVPPGKLSQTKLRTNIPADDAVHLLRLAASASDFNEGCGTVADGTSARMLLSVEGKEDVRQCANAPDWPAGRQVSRFVRELNGHLPQNFQIF